MSTLNGEGRRGKATCLANHAPVGHAEHGALVQGRGRGVALHHQDRAEQGQNPSGGRDGCVLREALHLQHGCLLLRELRDAGGWGGGGYRPDGEGEWCGSEGPGRRRVGAKARTGTSFFVRGPPKRAEDGASACSASSSETSPSATDAWSCEGAGARSRACSPRIGAESASSSELSHELTLEAPTGDVGRAWFAFVSTGEVLGPATATACRSSSARACGAEDSESDESLELSLSGLGAGAAAACKDCAAASTSGAGAPAPAEAPPRPDGLLCSWWLASASPRDDTSIW